MDEESLLDAELPLHAVTLRYFDPRGPFAAAATAACGVALPGALRAVEASPGLILAWLRPSETLALCEESARLEALVGQLSAVPGGHVVDLSGGLKALRLRGVRAAQLMSRLGGSGTVPGQGEARRGRLADVSVLAICVRAGEVLLLVERVYAQHLLEWIRATVAELGN